MDLFLDIRLYTGLIMIAMAIGLGIYLTRRFRLGWRLWFIGAAGFVLSQVGHIPFNGLLNVLFLQGILPMSLVQNVFGTAIIAGLSAGLWEELVRAGIFRWAAKDARSWRKGVLLGAGHGGIEAIILGMLVFGTFIYMFAIRGINLEQMVPPEQLALAQQQIQAYWSSPWTVSILGPVERALTIPCHIAMSVMVLQAFTRKQPWWIALAVLFHALLDAAAVVSISYLNVYATEGVIALFTAFSLWVIFALRQPEPVENAPELPPLEPVSGIRPEDVSHEITKEDLDRSRYS